MQDLRREEWENAYLRSIQGPHIKRTFVDFVYNSMQFGGHRKPSIDTLKEWAAEPIFQQNVTDRLHSMRKGQLEEDVICKFPNIPTPLCSWSNSITNSVIFPDLWLI